MINTDSCWTVIEYIVPIVEILIGGYCFYRLSKPFMENKRGTFLVGVSYSLTMLIFYMTPLPFDSFMPYGAGVFAAFLVMCRTDRGNYGQKVFLSVTFFALRGFTFSMAEILYDRLYDFAADTDFMEAHPNMFLGLYIGVCAFYLLLGFGLTAVGIWCILKTYAYKHERMSKKELLVLVIPSVMGVVGYEIIWSYRIFYLIEAGKMSVFYDTLSLLYYTVAVMAIVAVIVLYQSIKAGQEEKLQNELLATQIENTKKHMEQVENLYQNIVGMKHDMTNHIITLERLYAGNKRKEARAYSNELKAALLKPAGRIKSGNPVTDVILQEMQMEADRRQIHFETDFHYPKDSNVNAFDMSVILNNALQNALEYADKLDTSIVSVLSYRRNNAYMIEVKNSFTGSLKWDEESGLPMTSKEKMKGGKTDRVHGYGLSNIRRVALKYAGDIAIDVKDGMFCLSILLMMEE